MPAVAGDYSEVLRACEAHCRAIASEIYLSTTAVQRGRRSKAR
jgi:hypothetical protein